MSNKQIKMSAKYKKKYKCPYCEERLDRSKLANHIEKKHSELIPEGFTASRVAFNTMNKKTVGHCIMCGNETEWNEDKCRYERLCNSKKCHKKYLELVEKRLQASRGQTKKEMMSDPEFQNKMLNNRRISGTYKFSDGGKINYVGKYERNFLEFMDKFLHVQSSDIQSPGPTIEYWYDNKKHFWITDFYYIPYNLVLDIKDGGDNPNKRDMPVYRAKQTAKEKAIETGRQYNYIRLTDNQFNQLIDIMLDLKDSMIDLEGPYNQKIAQIQPIIRINEDYIRILNDYKNPENCSWDEENTWKSINDAIKDRSVDSSKPMYVYRMDPKTYENTYLGTIKSEDDGETYSWTYQVNENSLIEPDINIISSDKIVSMLSVALSDPNVYKTGDISNIISYIKNIGDRFKLSDVSIYLDTAITEVTERYYEYNKFLASGKCVWVYQLDFETFKSFGVTVDGIRIILDKLKNLRSFITEETVTGFDLEYLVEFVM